jgi:hypothetical protein
LADSKSGVGNNVSVQVRFPAPLEIKGFEGFPRSFFCAHFSAPVSHKLVTGFFHVLENLTSGDYYPFFYDKTLPELRQGLFYAPSRHWERHIF